MSSLCSWPSGAVSLSDTKGSQNSRNVCIEERQGTLISFQCVLSQRLSFDATPYQKEHGWQKLVKVDVLSKLEYQPLCNGRKTSTFSLPQMTTVWPGPRQLYSVILTPAAAVFRSPLISPFSFQQSGQLVLCCTKGGYLSPLMCDSLTVSLLCKDGVQQTRSKVPGIQLVTTDSQTPLKWLSLFITQGQRSRWA